MINYYILVGKQAVLFDVGDFTQDPARLMEWGRTFKTVDRHVARTEIGEVLVSTVFLGLDHNHFGGPPLLFETMAFIGGESVDQWRYSTWGEAETGHMEVVEQVQAMIAQAQEITRTTLRAAVERRKQEK